MHSALPSADADARNLFVAIVVETRCCNRYGLHTLAYVHLRNPLGSPMCCNVLRTVTAACKVMRSTGEIGESQAGPNDQLPRPRCILISVHSPCTVISFPSIRLPVASLNPKEAELTFRKGKLFFNLVVFQPRPGKGDQSSHYPSGPWAGCRRKSARAKFVHKHLARPRHVRTNSSVRPDVTPAIAMEDLTHIRDRINAGSHGHFASRPRLLVSILCERGMRFNAALDMKPEMLTV